MEKVKEKWLVHSKKLDFKKYAEIFNIDQVTARVIRNRGLITQEEFDIYLNAGMDKMYNPMLMKDMGLSPISMLAHQRKKATHGR